MAWDSRCSECAYIDVLSENKGKYPCTNSKSGVKVVSARRPKCGCFCAIGVSKRTTSEARALEANSQKYGYFIMTAVTEILGLDEDNKYLTTFKYAKDEVMPNVDEYASFLQEYETTGPIISEKLLEQEDAYEYAEMLKVAYLDEFAELVCMERVDDAITLYKEMYEMLLQDFHIQRAVPKPVMKSLYNPEHK